jgi:signal peptidase II
MKSICCMLMKKNALWLLISIAVFVLDQWTKNLVTAHFFYQEVLPICSGFNLTLAHNNGAAFSFLAQMGGWQRWFFAAIALGVSVVLTVWLLRLPASSSSFSPSRKGWLALGLALLIGGAWGNLYDRLVLGYVVDFIDVYYGNYHWPAFNVADSAITGGVILLFFDAWLESRANKANEQKP